MWYSTHKPALQSNRCCQRNQQDELTHRCSPDAAALVTFDTVYSLWVANIQCSVIILGLPCAQKCAPEWTDWDTGSVCWSKIVLRPYWRGERETKDLLLSVRGVYHWDIVFWDVCEMVCGGACEGGG